MKHDIIRAGFRREDPRGGFLEVLNTGSWESVLCGHMTKEAVMGRHYHKKTEVFFFLHRGAADIKTVHVETGEEDEFQLQAEEGVYLRPNEAHVITYLEDSDFLLLKSLRYDPKDNDTYSLEEH